MQAKKCLWMAVGTILIFNSMDTLNAQMEHRPSSAAAEADHKMQAKDFGYVHALAMDADGRILFLGAHTGLFRSEDGGTKWERH